MTILARIRVDLSGSGVVGPGVSTFYVAEADLDGSAAAIGDFYAAVIGNFPDDLTFTVRHSGDTINDANGQLAGTWSETGVDETIVGTVNTGFLQGTGARVRWQTNGIHKGRRVRGTTFMVPMAAGAFTTAGLLSTATAAALDGAAEDLIAATALRIWSRPSPGGSDGTSSLVTSAVVPLQVTTLRSRRT